MVGRRAEQVGCLSGEAANGNTAWAKALPLPDPTLPNLNALLEGRWRSLPGFEMATLRCVLRAAERRRHLQRGGRLHR